MATIRTKDLTNASAPSDTSESLWDNLASTVRVNYLELKADIAASFVAAPATYDLATLHTDGLLKSDQVRFSGLTFIGTSTVAALPAPGTRTAGDFYITTDSGVAYTKTFVAGESAISDGTNYSVGTNPTQVVANGGTGAVTAAAARTNLDVMATAAVNDRFLDRAPSNALRLGNNGYIKPAAALSTTALQDKFTICFSARINALPAYGTILGMITTAVGAGSTSSNGAVHMNADGTIDFDHWNGSGYDYLNEVVAAVELGKVYHFTYRVDSTAEGLTPFVDGVKGSSIATPVGVLASGMWQFGASNKDNTHNEILDCKIFNRALTDAECALYAKRGTVELEDQWGNADGGTYTSDFTSNSIDGFAFDSANTPTSDATATVGADTDNVKFVAGSGTGTARMWKTVGATGGKRYRVSFDYYMPSGQSYVDGFKTGVNVNLTSGNYTDSATLTTNAWTPFTADLSSPLDPANLAVFIILKDGTSTTIDALAVGEYIAFRNIKVTEIGAVTSLSPGNIVNSRWIDNSTNTLDGTITGGTAINNRAGSYIHSPSDAATDVVEEITAGASSTVLSRRYGNGLLMGGVHAQSLHGGSGYDQLLALPAIADTATLALASPYILGGLPRGFVTFTNSSGSGLQMAIFALQGSVGAPVIVSDPFNTYSNAVTTSGRINVYYDSGLGAIAIENLSGASISLTVRLSAHYLA